MNLIYLTRQEWGADDSLPRLGAIVPGDERTEVYIHHTVAIDSDATPNIWETMHEVTTWMQRLQTIRPDLGKDVPYNYVGFFMPDELVICEGRGSHRSGAHTIGHNRSAIGLAVHGNFNLPTFGLTSYLPAIGAFLWSLQVNKLPFLGTNHPPGRDVFGHRDVYQTACPGNNLYALLDDIKIEPPEEEDDDMTDEQWSTIQNTQRQVLEVLHILKGGQLPSQAGLAYAKSVLGRLERLEVDHHPPGHN